MKNNTYLLIDFDDTLLATNTHVINAYNSVTSDTLRAEDFIFEHSWDNLAKHKALWRTIIDTIVIDPSGIPPVIGAIDFFKLCHEYGHVVIVSKRFGINIIKDYLRKHGIYDILLNKTKFILVSKNTDKIKYINRLREQNKRIFIFDDRTDVIKWASSKTEIAFIQERPWNVNNLKNVNNVVYYPYFSERVILNMLDFIKNFSSECIIHNEFIKSYNILCDHGINTQEKISV